MGKSGNTSIEMALISLKRDASVSPLSHLCKMFFLLRNQVWVYFMEAAMFIIFLLQWAFTFPGGSNGAPSDRET